MYIKTVTLLVIGTCLYVIPLHSQKKDIKPNIVVFIADDLGYQDVEPYGNKQVHTPNIQQLADEGMCFDNMFTSTAMCSPTRQQLLTGLFPVRNGAYPNHSHVYHGTKSIAHYLQEEGYLTAIIGKRDIGNQESFPFTFLGGRGMDVGKSKDIELNKAEAFIKQAENRPYFLVVASNQPHVPWLRGNRKAYPPERITVPKYMVDTDETRESLSKYYAEVTYLDSLVGKTLDIIATNSKIDNTLIIYTSEQGAQFPFAKWTCYDQGLKTNFIVKWRGHIEPKSRNDALVQYVDVVPTLLDLVGINPDIIDTGNKDVYGDNGFDGMSFKKILEGKKNNFRNYVFGVQTTSGILKNREYYPVRSIRDKEYLYIKNLNSKVSFSNIETASDLMESWLEENPERARAYKDRPPQELYNVLEDPYQLHNIADLPENKKRIRRMEDELDTFMKQQGDKGMETEMLAKSLQNK